ncbi:hypothetical protein [Oculatella sp. FACHB-28]|uniref:hypothetical protein n=1 Tax=Oculatella sp. FACHB-28 TaxID=2692845 RepID=UPI001F548B7C|nr:hypothetical protein [Oculatella sp. FACHB-28]
MQAITGLKPDGPIDGREQYKQIFSTFFDAFPPVPGLEMIVEDILQQAIASLFGFGQCKPMRKNSLVWPQPIEISRLSKLM